LVGYQRRGGWSYWAWRYLLQALKWWADLGQWLYLQLGWLRLGRGGGQGLLLLRRRKQQLEV